jgi:hypothetical protein
MPLFDEFGDRAKLAELPKEYFCDIDMRSGPWSSLGETHLLTLKPGTPSAVNLVIADNPTQAKEVSLEILFKSEGETEAPTISLNGQLLKDLKSTRSASDLTLTLSSDSLKSALKRGTNEFRFVSQSSTTVAALSVYVVP